MSTKHARMPAEKHVYRRRDSQQKQETINVLSL